MTGPRLLVHTSAQPIRWGDMDALGHVNNTVYFRYMEQARIEWLFAHAKAHGGYESGQGPVIVNASCNFLVPLVYPGDVEVTMYLGHPGRIERRQLLRHPHGRPQVRGRRREDRLDRSRDRPAGAAAGRDRRAAARSRGVDDDDDDAHQTLGTRRPSASRRRTSPRSPR